ncbi:hypothetical protein ACJX0J_040616 [Zea mays]
MPPRGRSGGIILGTTLFGPIFAFLHLELKEIEINMIEMEEAITHDIHQVSDAENEILIVPFSIDEICGAVSHTMHELRRKKLGGIILELDKRQHLTCEVEDYLLKMIFYGGPQLI